MKTILTQCRRIVVKVGSSLVTNQGAGLDLAALGNWARQIAALNAAGCEVVLVSSGAIAEGMQRLGWRTRPASIHDLQAAAAVGQMGLVQAYESCFRKHELPHHWEGVWWDVHSPPGSRQHCRCYPGPNGSQRISPRGYC